MRSNNLANLDAFRMVDIYVLGVMLCNLFANVCFPGRDRANRVI